jgi:hypothetical protein
MSMSQGRFLAKVIDGMPAGLPVMSAPLILVLAGLGLLMWFFLRRSVSSARFDVPWVTFEGDDAEARYMTGYGDIIAQGYTKVSKSTFCFCIQSL